MKWAVKLVLCFLIAWLPFPGYAAQAPSCQHAASVGASVGASGAAANQIVTSHTAAPMVHRDDAAATLTHHQAAACHGGSADAPCGNAAALPVCLSLPAAAPSTIAHPLRDCRLLSQFIPDLPQRPPQFL